MISRSTWVLAAAGIVTAASAVAQNTPSLNNLSKPAAQKIAASYVQNVQIDENRDGSVVINFDPSSNYMPTRHGMTLTSENLKPYGVAVSSRIMVQECGASLNYASECLIKSSGRDNYAAYVRGDTITLTFDPPIANIALEITPANPDGQYGLDLAVKDANGKLLNSEFTTTNLTAPSGEIGFTSAPVRYWSSLSVADRDDYSSGKAEAQAVNTIYSADISIKSDRLSGFLIDTIALKRLVDANGNVAVTSPPSEVAEKPIDLIEVLKEYRRDADKRDVLRDRLIEKDVRPPSRKDDKRPFKAAQVDRVPIDWAGAKLLAKRFLDSNLLPKVNVPQEKIDRVTLPVLLPRLAESDTLVIAKPDFYHAALQGEDWYVEIHGTRLLLRGEGLGKPERDAEGLEFFETETGIATSFSLFGASYTVSLTCDSVETKYMCKDETFLRQQISDLIPVLGKPAEDAE